MHEQLNKLRAELGVLKVKLELRVGNAGHISHIDAADSIAAGLQKQLLPPFEEPTKPAMFTDILAGGRAEDCELESLRR